MNRSLILLLALLPGCGSPLHKDSNDASRPAIVYVAPDGNDAWSGHQLTPNRRKTDGPLATLPRALEIIREQRQPNSLVRSQPATISIRGGSYFLREPLVLKPKDSGITLAAYQAEKPVVSGGRRIEGWKEVTVSGRRMWSADIPEASQGKWLFHELWVDGKRAVRARHPNKGYLSVEGLLEGTPRWEEGHSRFRFRPGDLKSSSTVSNNSEVVVMNRWVESRLPIFMVDDAERSVSFVKRSVFELAGGDLYYLEGALEWLDESGEWFCDQQTGTLYYLPRPGERLDQIEALAPVLLQLIRLEGQPKAAQFVERVAFRGLTFSHSEWYFPLGFEAGKNKPTVSPAPKAEVGGFAQAAVGVPGAVWGEGARGCVFDHCSFSNLGSYGLELAAGCQSNHISHCEFSDLAGGGVKIGETAIREDTAEQTRANEISDCHIHDGGKLFHSAIGIWIGQSADNRIAHNLIHDFYYTGISIGWTWGYGKSLATNNTVEFNHVHHIGVKSNGDGPILSDMGGIYTLGIESGTVIRNNVWHDIAALRYGGWGIYFDEGSSGILAENNVAFRTTHGGFHQHYGATNIVRNNIFAFGRDHQIQRTRPEAHISFSFETNIVYFDSGKLLEGDWSGDNYKIDSNLYFDARPGAKPETFPLGPGSWEKWRERGHDTNSILVDPLFVAPQQNDFRLQSNSPAFKLGFKNIDLTHVGVRDAAR